MRANMLRNRIFVVTVYIHCASPSSSSTRSTSGAVPALVRRQVAQVVARNSSTPYIRYMVIDPEDRPGKLHRHGQLPQPLRHPLERSRHTRQRAHARRRAFKVPCGKG